MNTQLATPDKDAIALLPPFERLELDRIVLVTTGSQAQEAKAQLMQSRAWGFDTESKPTFHVGEASDGPHILQLATPDKAWVLQLHDPACRAVAAELLAMPGFTKAGFGLGDDKKRILHKLGVEPAGVLELNTVFRERGYRKGAEGCAVSWQVSCDFSGLLGKGRAVHHRVAAQGVGGAAHRLCPRRRA